MGNSSKRDIGRAMTAERANRALDLRKQGATYRSIAASLGVQVAYAHRLVQDAIAAIPRENAEDVKTLELERLNRLLEAVWPRAMKGDAKAVLASVKLMERRAKYLGLDAVQKHEVTGADGGPIVVDGAHDDLLSRLAKLAADARTRTGDPEPKPS